MIVEYNGISYMESLIQILGDKVKIKSLKDNCVIWIPNNYLDDVKALDDKQLLTTIELEEIK